MPLKYPKPLKTKPYNPPDEKYVVVVHPWPQIPQKDEIPQEYDRRRYERDRDRRRPRFQETINMIGTWFEKMLGTGSRASVVYHMHDKREFVIVELPAHINVESILGAHYNDQFLKPRWVERSMQPMSLIYEYDFKRQGHPSRKRGFSEAFPSYLPNIFERFQDNYPSPSLPPPPRSIDLALPIPGNVIRRLQQNEDNKNGVLVAESSSSFQRNAATASTSIAVKQEQPSTPLPPINGQSTSRPMKQEPPLHLATLPIPDPVRQAPQAGIQPTPIVSPIPPSANANDFTPYVRPSYLVPRPGGSTVRAGKRERESTVEPSGTSGLPSSIRRTPGPRDPPELPTTTSTISTSFPRDSTEPPDVQSPPVSFNKPFTKRDPYEEEEESKLFLQDTPSNAPSASVKDEPVEVKMDVDDVSVDVGSDNNGDFDVNVKQEQNDTSLISSSTSRVKPEPIEEGIPDISMSEDAFNEYECERLSDKNSLSSGMNIRVKSEPELESEVRVKDEPVDNSIPEDIFDAFMQGRASSSGSQSPRSTSVKPEPAPKSEPLDDEIPLDLFNAYMQHKEASMASSSASGSGNRDSNTLSVSSNLVCSSGPRGVKREREADEDDVQSHNQGHMSDSAETSSHNQPAVIIKPEPLDSDADLGLLKRESGSDSNGTGEAGPASRPVWRRKRERNVDAVFGDDSSSSGAGTVGSGSVKVKDEPGLDRSMPPPPPPSFRPGSSDSPWRQRSGDQSTAKHPLPAKPKMEEHDDFRANRAKARRHDHSEDRRSISNDPRHRSPSARVKREGDQSSRTQRTSNNPSPTPTANSSAQLGNVRVKKEDIDTSNSFRSRSNHNARNASNAPTPGIWAPTSSSLVAPTPNPSSAAFSSLHARTPAFGGLVGSGSTPGWSMDYESMSYKTPYDAPEDWLLDEICAPHLRKLKVRIHGTISKAYLNGAYEGRTATVVGATRVRGNFDQTAFLRFDGDGEMRSMLLKYVVPALPRNQDELALVLTGRQRGEMVKVTQKPESGNDMEMVVVEAVGGAGAAFWECQKDHLCACVG